MAYTRICKRTDLSPTGCATFMVSGKEILLLWPRDAEPKAFQGVCPHQEVSLADALFDGRTLMCQAHRWIFDAETGQGLAPHFSSLQQYALCIEDGVVSVDVGGIVPSAVRK